MILKTFLVLITSFLFLFLGTERWPPGCTLKHISGYLMCFCDRLIVDPLEPGQVIDISVEMLSPLQAGIYESRWRMCTATGQFFGGIVLSAQHFILYFILYLMFFYIFKQSLFGLLFQLLKVVC